MDGEMVKGENCVASILEGLEKTCWGCGLRLLLSSDSPIFKCGWCGAITNGNQNSRKPDSPCFSRWRRVQDGLFVSILLMFILFVTCAGLWAVYPIIFSISYFCGVFHCTITAILSLCTICTFCSAAFRSAGEPANVLWGSYPAVGKGGLEDYTFCTYCAKPKSPRAHHCRSCRTCILDMDHHCPFIGNCVGAANHRSFIAFLISVVISCMYVAVMTVWAGFHTWPSLEYGPLRSSIPSNSLGATRVIKDVSAALARSALLLSARGLVLVYLAIASTSVEIGISVLLWQQLQFIYEGKTYINHISSRDGGPEERGCQNILRFFSCPFWVFRLLLGSPNAGKLQETSKLL